MAQTGTQSKELLIS
uniref:Uncharacterized protein n=1 Tax=Anguilla anguilla TaxID=7936 RepID=A0A0E9UQF6_ANGAN